MTENTNMKNMTMLLTPEEGVSESLSDFLWQLFDEGKNQKWFKKIRRQVNGSAMMCYNKTQI